MYILLIEDDNDLNSALNEALTVAGFTVDSVYNAQDGLSAVQKQKYNIIISDVKMPGLSGYDFLEKLSQSDNETPVLLMTAFGTIEQAVAALKLGAKDYITKPFEMNDLIHKIKTHAVDVVSDIGVVMASNASIALFDVAKKVSKTDASVLIQGESGTGKEVLARYIHEHSNRCDQAFIGINCAAIPDNMLEATLFGYEKGAFTGAYQSTAGKFESANGGTLLLDEISEMPLNLQVKLLRVLQENEVERLGGKKQIPLDVRIIATTNRTLSEEVKEGKFREDLYFRLNVFPITWQPLRERVDDILPLAHSFVQQFSPDKMMSKDAESQLLRYSWPGNIRELQNVIQRASILTPCNTIEPEHLIFEETHLNQVQSDDLSDNLSQKEFEVIREVLEKNNGSRQDAAKQLGVSPRTLRYKLAKMKKLGIEV